MTNRPWPLFGQSAIRHSSFRFDSTFRFRNSSFPTPPTAPRRHPGAQQKSQALLTGPGSLCEFRCLPAIRGEGRSIGSKLATERAAAQAAHASFRGGRSGFFGRSSVRRSSFFRHFTVATAIAATIATAVASAIAAVATIAATMAAAVATTMATTMAATVATTMATAVATTGEQTAVAAAVAATVTRAAAAAITGAASAVARATTAVTGDRLAGPAHQGQAHHRAENRDAKNQCTIHPRILQKQQVPYRRGIGNASAVRDASRSPLSGRPTQTGRVHLEPMPPPTLDERSQALPLRVKQDVTTAQARSLG